MRKFMVSNSMTLPTEKLRSFIFYIITMLNKERA